jgi:sec-independent protein translocase protein TatC
MGLLPVRRRRREEFERAADGSMTLMEHLRELRDRLFKAVLGVVAGMILGWFLSDFVLNLLTDPFCAAVREIAIDKNGGTPPADWTCDGHLIQLKAGAGLQVRLQVSMWIGLIVAGPIWLYQLWAFIAPGLHRHERRWAYAFAGAAAPLFALGALLAYVVVAQGLALLLSFSPDDTASTLELTGYIDFITGLMLLFGVAFEFPLAILLLNVAGVVSAKKLLSWWRVIVFLFFLFAAVATPTADPFGMTFLALALSALYFGACGLAALNDKRRARKSGESFGNLSDDEISPLSFEPAEGAESLAAEPVAVAAPLPPVEPVAAPTPLERRYDDIT